ncbi:MAG: DNA mismatch repair protein MutS [Candidatus Kapabacteria bacterium]|jgi:DNA mismatch repair protein MutS|nr:DNA mismatch repair protein MutS [Candidatus Kapabacteria bacterium]
MADKQTPLMRQYSQIKKKYPDTVLLFRLGDFFETFEDDAIITAKACGITLTKRNNGGADETPLAGFPHHQLDNYLPKLVRAGYRVAVCEQLEDPKQARGIVRRDVVEVVTPGVAFNEKLLDARRNNYVAGLVVLQNRNTTTIGVSCADISTAEFFTTETDEEHLATLLETLQPAEILIPKGKTDALTPHIRKAFPANAQPALTRLEDWVFEERFGRDTLLRQFKTQNLKGFGIEELSAGVAAAGVVMHYLQESQKGQLTHIQRVSLFNPSEYMTLDFATKRNLEITFSMNDASREGTLIGILDKTETPMGSRLFKKWITRPLRRLAQIHQRQRAVDALFRGDSIRAALRSELGQMGDVERLIAKISTGRATPRDVVALGKTLARLPRVKELCENLSSESLTKAVQGLHDVSNVVERITTAFVEEPPAQVGNGGVFREGFAPELDDIVNVMYSGKNWIADYQERERTATGIPSLKVGFTGVFGYYIEISNAHKNKAPEQYQRKQTLTNGERYTTPELKEMEAKILTAEERLADAEREIFGRLRTEIAGFAADIQHNAALVAAIDCLQSFAEAARQYDYVCPEMDESDTLHIENGRHPVVERLLPIGEKYVPNSTRMDTRTEQMHIITGPNMSGKSSYLRQIGLITLLAHIGAFVPAQKAHIGLTDRIFTRVGAQDNITAGESTFLVEMQEAANIINNATPSSLILLDEVGRGTATFDGIAIAWAIAEYLHDRTGAKTLFATHYHEMTSITERLPKARNYKADVQEVGNSIIFTRRVVEGTANHSFGIHVAEMAGLPKDLTERARVVMRALEEKGEGNSSGVGSHWSLVIGHSSGDSNSATVPMTNDQATNDQVTNDQAEPQFSLFEIRDDKIRERIRKIDVNALTPLQALTLLSELRAMVDAG